MRATVMYQAGDVRVQDVPGSRIREPTDALVRVTRACVCGSDLWPYRTMEAEPDGRRMGHEFIGVVEDIGPEVASIARGDVVVAPFVFSDGTCEFCTRAYPPRAGTAGSGALAMSTAVRARQRGFRWPTGRWWPCRSARTTR